MEQSTTRCEVSFFVRNNTTYKPTQSKEQPICVDWLDNDLQPTITRPIHKITIPRNEYVKFNWFMVRDSFVCCHLNCTIVSYIHNILSPICCIPNSLHQQFGLSLSITFLLSPLSLCVNVWRQSLFVIRRGHSSPGWELTRMCTNNLRVFLYCEWKGLNFEGAHNSFAIKIAIQLFDQESFYSILDIIIKNINYLV